MKKSVTYHVARVNFLPFDKEDVIRTIDTVADARYTNSEDKALLTERILDALFGSSPTFLRDLVIFNLCGKDLHCCAQAASGLTENPFEFEVLEFPVYRGAVSRPNLDNEMNLRGVKLAVTRTSFWPTFGGNWSTGSWGVPYDLFMVFRSILETILLCYSGVTFVGRRKTTWEDVARITRELDQKLLTLDTGIPEYLPSEVLTSHLAPEDKAEFATWAGVKLDAAGEIIPAVQPRMPLVSVNPVEAFARTAQTVRRQRESVEMLIADLQLEKGLWRGLSDAALKDWAESLPIDSFLWIELTETIDRIGQTVALTEGYVDEVIGRERFRLCTRIPLLKEFRDAYLRAGCPALVLEF